VRLEATLTDAWWDACAEKPRVGASDDIRSAARTVMSSSPAQLFASLERDGAVIGVARVAFASAWAGVSALQVAPDHRRTGVATQLMGALADASRARGIRSMYLQVTRDNSPARSLYERLGFSIHHDYLYLGG
jgi:GNAT superfamily N-acetyltransferase